MKKIISFFCAVLLLASGVPVYAGDLIPDYEPWKYMTVAGMGSCSECDPSYTFQTNHFFRERERKAGEAALESSIKDLFGSDSILKDFSGSELLMIGALTAGISFIIFSVIFEKTEYVKTSY